MPDSAALGLKLARGALAAIFAGAMLVPAAALADDLQDATKLLKSGQHQQALDKVNQVLSAKPRDAQARFLKGLILTEQGNTKESIAIFQKLTEDYPDLPEPFNNLAVIYASQGQYDKARGALEQSIRTHPSYATAYENLGDVYAKLASQAYDKALQIDSANAGAQNKLALVRELVGGPRASKPAPTAVAAVAAKPTAETKPEPKVDARPEPKPDAKSEPRPEAKPAPEAAKPAAQPASSGDDIVQMVNSWAQAWSKKDVDGYLRFYASDFKTPNGEARAAWEKSRRQRIGAPKTISVTVQAPKVSVNGDKASVTFRQGYRSDVLAARTSTKTLVLAKANGRWLIQQEKVVN
jgi:tetratricopeptide (TPR) repeat protein